MSELVGHTIAGRYRVDAFLGRGGMAEVYKVWDVQRSVYLAMKVLNADLAEDKVFLRRFRREAETLSRLQHPNIVRFYGLEQVGRLVFILMDYVEGISLRSEIFDSKGPFSNQRVQQVMQSVCVALQYAHNQGFVHCDVKPGNIMVDKTGRVLVSDFGIARMTESATATMAGAGTPAYMSPEQVRGEMPSPQTDIYSLGVVLFEMLTGGERPFTGEHARTTGSTSEKVRWEQVYLKPPSLRQLNASVSPELEAVVMKCLEKEPGRRYAGVTDLIMDLGRVLPGASRIGRAVQTGATMESHFSPSPPPQPYPQPPVVLPAEAQPQSKLESRRVAGWAVGGCSALFLLTAMIVLGVLILPNLLSGSSTVIPPPTNTLRPAYTPRPTSTPLPPPTSTRVPTATPDYAATQSARATEKADAKKEEIKNELDSLDLTSNAGHLGWVQSQAATVKNTGYWEPVYGSFAEGLQASDFVMKADITWHSTSFVGCGLIMRSTSSDPEKNDSATYYRFYYQKFSGLPGWHISFYKEGEWSYYITGDWHFASAFHQENGATNTIVLAAQAEQFTLFINGERIGRYFDYSESASRGYFGAVSVQDTGTSTCKFENGWVWIYK